MMLFVVVVIGACYLVRFLLLDRRDPVGRPGPEMLRINRDLLADRAPGSASTTGTAEAQSIRWTSLDDHQLRRLLEQSSP